MIRTKRLGFLVSVAAVSVAAPAMAQFGSIFGGPPRPPADVPMVNRDPRLPPPVEAERYPPYEPELYPPYESRRRAPEPPPPPLTRLPSSPGPGGVQSQPLPPPPGAAPPPPAASPDVAVHPPEGRPGQPPLVGLPPGQRQPRGTPQPGNTAPAQPGDEVVVAPPAQRVVNATAVFAGLDKITGRIISFDVAIDETVQFGALRLTPRACYTSPPTETPNTDGFVEVDEITLQGEVKRIFTGWMFAASPGLHAVEHPIYDVWLTDCKNERPAVASAQPAQPDQQPGPGAAQGGTPPAAAAQQPPAQRPAAPSGPRR